MGFNLSTQKAADTADCIIRDAEGNEWVISLAGPAHPKTKELADRSMRERLNEEKRQEMSRVNGKKYTPEDRTPDEARRRSVDNIVGRIVTWRGLADDAGIDVPFSPDTAREIFSDPANGLVFSRLIDFLTEEQSFIKRSAINS